MCNLREIKHILCNIEHINKKSLLSSRQEERKAWENRGIHTAARYPVEGYLEDGMRTSESIQTTIAYRHGFHMRIPLFKYILVGEHE